MANKFETNLEEKPELIGVHGRESTVYQNGIQVIEGVSEVDGQITGVQVDPSSYVRALEGWEHAILQGIEHWSGEVQKGMVNVDLQDADQATWNLKADLEEEGEGFELRWLRSKGITGN